MSEKSLIIDMVAKAASLISVGQMPIPDEDDVVFLDETPGAIFATLDCLADEIGKPQSHKEDRFSALLWLLTLQLNLNRSSAAAGFAWAQPMLDDFQANLAAHIHRKSNLDDDWRMVLSIFRQLKIPLAPAVRAAYLGVDDPNLAVLNPEFMKKVFDYAAPMLAEMVKAVSKDPFELSEAVTEFVGDIYPPVVKSLLVKQMILAKGSSAAECQHNAAVLLLLDPDLSVRQALLPQIAEMVGRGALSNVSLRRLAFMVGWLPAEEGAAVQAVVDAARSSGVKEESWPKPLDPEIYASIIDGFGWQNLYIAAGNGKKCLSSGFRFHQRHGFESGWCAYPLTRARVNDMVTMSDLEAATVKTGRAYLDVALEHALALGLAQGIPGPASLLRLAELIGGQNWRPRSFDIAAAIALLSPEEKTPEAIDEALERSFFWDEYDMLFEQWLQDSPEFEAAREAIKSDESPADILADELLANVMEKDRAVWAERFALSALMVKDANYASDLPEWQDFMIISHVINDGLPLSDVPALNWIVISSINGLEPFDTEWEEEDEPDFDDTKSRF